MLADSVDVTVSSCRVPRYIVELSADSSDRILKHPRTDVERV